MTKKEKIKAEQEIFNFLMTQERKCKRCSQTNNLTLDHIVPSSILKSFNVDVDRELIEGNYQILCMACNSKKLHFLDFADEKTKPLLIKLLERV